LRCAERTARRYWRVIKNTPDATIVVLWDKPENILQADHVFTMTIPG